MGLLDLRLAERDRQHTVAQVEAAPARLDVDHDVAAGQRVLDGALDEVGREVALDHGLPGRHADDDIGEVAAGGLAQAQAAELDVG